MKITLEIFFTLGIYSYISSIKLNTIKLNKIMLVTKKGQKFKVNIPNWLEQDPSGFVFEEGVIYTCTEVLGIGLLSEIYVGDYWISGEYTVLVQ